MNLNHSLCISMILLQSILSNITYAQEKPNEEGVFISPGYTEDGTSIYNDKPFNNEDAVYIKEQINEHDEFDYASVYCKGIKNGNERRGWLSLVESYWKELDQFDKAVSLFFGVRKYYPYLYGYWVVDSEENDYFYTSKKNIDELNKYCAKHYGKGSVAQPAINNFSGWYHFIYTHQPLRKFGGLEQGSVDAD